MQIQSPPLMKSMSPFEVSIRDQINCQASRRKKVKGVRFLPKRAHKQTSDRILRCQPLDYSSPHFLHIFSMLKVASMYSEHIWSSGCTKRQGTHDDNIAKASSTFGLSRMLLRATSPAVIRLPAIRIPCLISSSLILSIGAETNGGLKRKASRSMPVLAMVFPAIVAMAAPRECPASQIFELPVAETTFWTAWVAIVDREV